MFFKGSRYTHVPDRTATDSQGRPVRYKTTRFITPARSDRVHTVREQERLDHIAFHYYRDPELFWRVCDANGELWSDDLAKATRRIRIPSID